jgi:hypothetical protein
LVYCTGALMGCCEGGIELKVEKYKVLSWPANWLSTYLWPKCIKGIRVGYLQSKASSQSQIHFKTQFAFAIKTQCFYSHTNIIVIFP